MKQTKWLISLSACLFLMAASSAGVKGKLAIPCQAWEQGSIDTIPLPSRIYSIGKEVDSIQSPSSLQSFFDELDSLGAQFGNAGRGWIAPFKLSKTNEPDDYFISSSVREWVTGRCIQANKKCPVGIGGIGIQSVSPSINLDVRIAPNNGAGYSFNQAILYRGEKAMPMLPVDTLQLHSTRRKQGTDKLLPASNFKNVYYGFSLTNGYPGVLYHSVGVNGAMYVNYTDEAYVRQLALLKPSLLIISLGTNETFGRRFRSEEFGGQIRAFVSLVKKQMPETAILLTTPPECYKRTYVNKKRTYVRNSNTQLAAKAIVKAAREEGVACWDLFAATGGKSSCTKWRKEKLMGRDRIHFTKDGYREQGTLLYRALMQSYNQMLKIRKDDE